MHLIELHKLSDISLLQSIYKNISDFNLLCQMLIVYIPDLKKRSYKIPNLFFHILKLDFLELLELEEAVIADIICDLLELKANIILDAFDINHLSQKAQLIIGMLDKSGMNYVIPHRSFILDKEIDLENPSYNDFCIIKEIFNQKNDGIKFSINNFLFRYRIDGLGNIFFLNEHLGNVRDISVARLLHLETSKKDDIISAAEKRLFEFKEPFSCHFYEPWIFFIEDIDYMEEIIRYKYKIFNRIKNISPYQYPEIANDIVEILNRQNYVQMKDILKQISTVKGEGTYVSV